jgi:peptidoglycan/LPS O-acetylase OafA/YrhL
MFGWHVMDVLADPGAALERRALTSLIAGAAISAALILYRFPVAPLAWAGRYSFTIYLYHFFPILILQRVWEMAGVRPAWIGFALGMAAGVFLPVLAHWAAVKLGWIFPRLALGIEGRKAAGGCMPASRLPEKAGA